MRIKPSNLFDLYVIQFIQNILIYFCMVHVSMYKKDEVQMTYYFNAKHHHTHTNPKGLGVLLLL